MPGKDKRDYRRLPKSYRIAAKKFSFPLNDKPYVEFVCTDISAGGLCVECKNKFKEGERLQVRICVPRLNKFMPGFFKFYENDLEQYLNAIVEVAWIEETGATCLMGLRFLDLDEDAVKAVTGLIDNAFRQEERRKQIKQQNLN